MITQELLARLETANSAKRAALAEYEEARRAVLLAAKKNAAVEPGRLGIKWVRREFQTFTAAGIRKILGDAQADVVELQTPTKVCEYVVLVNPETGKPISSGGEREGNKRG